ncbi:Histone-lysine N-methyltransferase SETD1B-A [Portunus trituberculatus]|uniref:Histone-lysine N-methyltransferase SETD1B-A n=1 Tax=Portunus trituberculatus TaxID=210409 RepID=A0A5B7E912_PORTR|nr:Histone-lysine N-methyltransferase SETD1B-A [Portunus trituberculatus]
MFYPTSLVSSYPRYNPGYMALSSNYPQLTHSPLGTVLTGQNHYPYFGPIYPQLQNKDTNHKSGKYHDPTINAVLDTVIEELKNILKCDFNKSMIEAMAFKTFEARAFMPKMPSFRKVPKTKPPSPSCMDEDSRDVPSDEDSKQSQEKRVE